VKFKFITLAFLLASPLALAGSDGSDLGLTSNQGASSVDPEPTFGQKVTMTFVSGDKKFTTINGGFYHVGDSLADGTIVLDIQSGNVLLSKQGVQKWIPLENEPPRTELATSNEPITPFGYLDVAIAQLEEAIQTRSNQPESAEQLADLEKLRERLIAAKGELDSGTLSDAEQTELELEINAEWLQAQQKLDALRDRIANSGKGLSMGDLVSTQKILEDAVLATLREPLAKLQNPEYQGQINNQSSDLLKTVTELLGSYPDYQALADKLEATQKKE